MEKLVIASHAEFAEHIGKELGVSEYLKIDQERINVFADATLDHQWIHTDPERAKSEGGFGNTIAHGYLTLSILPHLWEQIADIRNIKMMINYGIERLTKCQLNVKLEIKDNPKPAFTGEMIFLYHFA